MPNRTGISGEQGYDGRAVANFILDHFDAHDHEISNLKLNKLIYFAHGFYGARFETRLIRNHIEAWQHGPVVRVVFDSFKRNGKNPVENRAEAFDYVLQKNVPISIADTDKSRLTFILTVVSHYVQYSAGQLVELTHLPGTPWHRARGEPSRLMDRIPDEWIRLFFVQNFGGSTKN